MDECPQNPGSWAQPAFLLAATRDHTITKTITKQMIDWFSPGSPPPRAPQVYVPPGKLLFEIGDPGPSLLGPAEGREFFLGAFFY